LYRKSAVPVAAHEGFHETEVTCTDSRTGCMDGVVIAEVW
jgi:hypothetical protein